MRTLIVLILGLLAFPSWASAQAAAAGTVPFAAEDIGKVSTASVLDLSEDGRRVAVAVRRLADNAEVDNVRYGDPTYVAPAWVRLLVIDTPTGTAHTPFKDLVNIQQASWSHDGKRLAILTAVNATPKPGQPSLPVTRVSIWDVDRAVLADLTVKGDMPVSVNSNLAWLPGDQKLLVTCRPAGWERDGAERFRQLTQGPVIVHTSKEPFLEWDALRRGLKRRVLAELDVASGQVTPLLPESLLTSYAPARDGSFVTFQQDVTEKTNYNEIGGALNDLRLLARPGTTPRTVAAGKDLEGLQLRWSDDGRTFAYAKKGEVFVQGIDGGQARSLTPEVAKAEANTGSKEPSAPPKDTASDPKDPKDPKAAKETFSVVSFSRDATRLLITSKKGWYVVNVADGTRAQVLRLDAENEEKNPRIEASAWSPDGKAIFATWSARDKWERGLVRLDAVTGDQKALVRDARLFGGFRLSRDGSTFVFTLTDGDRPAELYTADAAFTSIRKLTDLNPWVTDRALPRSELVSYRDSDGKLLHGVLRYPVGYQQGRKYPTVFELYETFFDNGFNARAAFLANRGYAVFHPSVNLVIGRPGEAWVKGVTSAANRLIDLGIADPDRLGVHGTSYGGYATALLITQTDRFKAAINISGKVNMVSFYTDSPRLGVRNIHAPEKSQDRLGATLWERPDLYLEHSAVLHADRVKTPLLCITGDQDPNVPASQSREMYYALRRLGRDVEWVRYANGAHRPPNSVTEAVDFEQRIAGWYDRWLNAEKQP